MIFTRLHDSLIQNDVQNQKHHMDKISNNFLIIWSRKHLPPAAAKSVRGYFLLLSSAQ